MNRIMGGGDSRLSLEIRGDDLQTARDISTAAKNMMDKVPGCAQRADQPRGRPARAGDRRRSAEGRAARPVASPTSPTASARTSPARRRRSSASTATSTRSSSGCGRRTASASRTSTTCLINAPSGQVLQAKNLLTLRNQSGPTEIQRKNQERILRVTAEPEVALSEAVKAVDAQHGRSARHLRTVLGRLRRGGRAAGPARSSSCR